MINLNHNHKKCTLVEMSLQVERVRRGRVFPGVRPRPRQQTQLRRVLRHDERKAPQRTGKQNKYLNPLFEGSTE